MTTTSEIKQALKDVCVDASCLVEPPRKYVAMLTQDGTSDAYSRVFYLPARQGDVVTSASVVGELLAEALGVQIKYAELTECSVDCLLRAGGDAVVTGEQVRYAGDEPGVKRRNGITWERLRRGIRISFRREQDATLDADDVSVRTNIVTAKRLLSDQIASVKASIVAGEARISALQAALDKIP